MVTVSVNLVSAVVQHCDHHLCTMLTVSVLNKAGPMPSHKLEFAPAVCSRTRTPGWAILTSSNAPAHNSKQMKRERYPQQGFE